MKTKIRLDDEKRFNQHDPPLRTNPQIPASISTDDLTIISKLNLPPNLPPVISLDMDTSEGAVGELSTDYFHIIQNNDQVKDKYKARIDKGKEWQKNLKDNLKGRNLTAGYL